MINSFIFVKLKDGFFLHLFVDSLEVCQLSFDKPSAIEVEHYLDENISYLETTSAVKCAIYVPLEPNTAKALYDFLADFPVDFSRFEYARK